MTTRFVRLAAAALMLAATPASSGTYELGALVLDTPWVRATPPGAEVAGGYVTITNTGERAARLVDGEAAFAGRVEIHEMTMADGVMRMRPLADGLIVPPGETVPLEPGGYHVMFMELVEPLVAGETVRATLTFADAGAIELPFTVAPIGASGPPVE
jgi:hypothetical protein